jgi:hypothetical protein
VLDAAVHKQSHVTSARWAAPKRGAGYTVYDPVGQKIGSAEQVFMNRDCEPVYIRVRIGLFGTKTVLIPVQFGERDEKRKTLVLK